MAPVALPRRDDEKSVYLGLFLTLTPDHLLSDTFIGQDTDSPDISRLNNNNSLQPYSQHTLIVKPCQEEVQPGSQSAPLPTSSKRCLSVERSLSSEDQHHQRCVESSLKPARVYTITRERDMHGGKGSKESLELEVLKRTTDHQKPVLPPVYVAAIIEEATIAETTALHTSNHYSHALSHNLCRAQEAPITSETGGQGGAGRGRIARRTVWPAFGHTATASAL